MCTCMSRWLPARILYSVGLASASSVGTCPLYIRNGVDKFLLVSKDFPVCRGMSTTKHRGETQENFHQENQQILGSTSIKSDKEDARKDDDYKREHASTLKSVMDKQEKDSNGKRTRELLSPLRPLPKKKAKAGHTSQKTFQKTTSLDFIPLPQSPPREKDELEDFFVIDVEPSANFPPTVKATSTHLPVPSTSSSTIIKQEKVVKSKGHECVSGLTPDNVAPYPRKKDTSSLFQCEAGPSKQVVPKFSEIVKSKRKEYIQRKHEIGDIQILYEGPREKQKGQTVMCKTKDLDKGSKELLSAERSLIPNQQFRNCHVGTKRELKDNPINVVQDEIDSYVNDCHKERKEKNSLRSQSRETSPDVQKVNVIDPDVVEIADVTPSSSKNVDFEVIDVLDSEDDNHESMSEDEGQVMDVSSSDFISLQKLRVADLHNTNIEIDDATWNLRKKLEDLRKWDMTGLGQEVLLGRGCRSDDTIFTVMSYNVLAQSLLTDQMALYRSCKSEHLAWQYRWALLQHEITDLDPDILMLQEVQSSHYHTYYLPWLTFRGYEGFYKKRTGTKADGCAIFYKTNTFSLIEHCSVEYRQPSAFNVLDRDNVGLIVKLAPVKRPHGTPLCVATTHLLYNPRRYDVKLAQAVLLLSEIDRLCFERELGNRTQYCPVIISGDFNADPHTALIDFFKKGRLHYEGLASKSLARHGALGKSLGAELIPSSLGITNQCQHSVLAQSRFLDQNIGPLFSLSDKRQLEQSLIHLHHSDRNTKVNDSKAKVVTGPQPSGWFTHGLNLNSVYSNRLSRLGGAPEVTTKHDRGWTTVDYIFYSRIYSDSFARPIEGNLKLLARYGLLSGSEAQQFSPLPSSVCPSDHFPLAAQFLLRK
ncbi:uncharacterized protein LOC134784712 isoform X1 [Penaeus indicus]|uniref:uncharacterized protein LOC134784712 isoform X1 n=2 Tax=Penaeus indicus TaxID=29960 RepID=UPI00300D7976